MPDAPATAVEAKLEKAVRDRYSAAARQREEALCCPSEYRGDYLRVIPDEILERDYGCGDPTPYVRPNETVVDLGSGTGKTCFILSQVVGPQGRVIGVDCNLEMLALARRHQPTVAERVGYANVEFRCGLIQDLRLDLDVLATTLAGSPVVDQASWLRLRDTENVLRSSQPMIADESVDCVVSNCVLNLVRRDDRSQLLAELFRVLKPGGRAAISDIVANRDVPEEMLHDAELWSGCVAGAFQEDQFLQAFVAAGFQDVQMAQRQTSPWRIVQGIEFRSVTIVAHKGNPSCCCEGAEAGWLPVILDSNDDAAKPQCC